MDYKAPLWFVIRPMSRLLSTDSEGEVDLKVPGRSILRSREVDFKAPEWADFKAPEWVYFQVHK